MSPSSGRIALSIGGIAVTLSFSPGLESCAKTLGRLLANFARESAPENAARLDVVALAPSNGTLSEPIARALTVPTQRFPGNGSAQEAIEFAEPFSEELNRVAEGSGPDLAAYSFPEGCILGCPEERAFTLALDRRTKAKVLPWAVLHGLYFLYSLLVAYERGLMLHASALMIEGTAALFVGRSGSGKSTLVKLAGEERALADDCVLLREEGEGFLVCDTPFNQVLPKGKGTVAADAAAGLGLFLEQSAGVRVEQVSPGGASAHILANHIHFFRHFPKSAAKEAFRRTAKLAAALPFYRLYFTKDESFMDVLKGLAKDSGRD